MWSSIRIMPSTAMSQPQDRLFSPEDVADFFIALADDKGDVMTNLKTQKLVYYAQAWHLAIKDKPLFEDNFQAWVHGPVIPTLYAKFKEKDISGSTPIPPEKNLETVKLEFDKETVEFLYEVADAYMAFNGYALEEMTHQEDPWKIARGNLAPDARCDVVITKESMKEFYAAQVKDQA